MSTHFKRVAAVACLTAMMATGLGACQGMQGSDKMVHEKNGCKSNSCKSNTCKSNKCKSNSCKTNSCSGKKEAK